MSSMVLLVEDNEDLRRDLAFLIKHYGFEVETARHGKEALEKLNDLGPPCLIILDLMMPVMDGWELRAKLLEDVTLAKVPVVLLSGVADLRNEASSLEAIAYLAKPVDLQKLCRIIQAHC